MSLEPAIREGASAMGVPLSDEQVRQCVDFLALIEKWNRVHNLTAVRDGGQMVILHLLDSFSILPHVQGARSVLDVGSGPGLPGIPIAIARPGIEVTLLDSSHKKASFLEQARAELELGNARVVCERVEQWRAPHTFDVVVSRAFADLGEFIAQAQHLVAPGGRMLAMKGVYPFEEIARVPPTHRVSNVFELKVPHLEAKRHLVSVERAG